MCYFWPQIYYPYFFVNLLSLDLDTAQFHEFFSLQNFHNFLFKFLQAAQLELAAGQPANTNALAIRRPFDPRAHDLDAHFRLTRFADLKG